MAFLTHNGSVVKVPGVGGSIVKGPEPPSYPVKGDLINMTLGNATPAAGTQDLYRVIKIDGSVAEVVAMYDIGQCAYSTTSSRMYSNGELDKLLNTTFYNSLNSDAKSAIVLKNVIAYRYTSNSLYYDETTHASYAGYSTKSVFDSIGNRYVYALDVEDIENYFNGIFSKTDVWTLFWNTTEVPSTTTYPMLRSMEHWDPPMYAYSININDYIGDHSAVYTNNDWARPAFQIDLSKIEYTKVS